MPIVHGFQDDHDPFSVDEIQYLSDVTIFFHKISCKKKLSKYTKLGFIIYINYIFATQYLFLITSMKYLFIATLSALILASCSVSENKNTQAITPTQEPEYSVSPADMVSPTLADTLGKSEISEQEKSSLLQMREEEKLAHDVYTALYQKWGKQILSNIAASEQTHTGAVLGLLTKYGIPDPAKSEPGVFTSPEIQKLYDTLVAQGNTSLLEALMV